MRPDSKSPDPNLRMGPPVLHARWVTHHGHIFVLGHQLSDLRELGLESILPNVPDLNALAVADERPVYRLRRACRGCRGLTGRGRLHGLLVAVEREARSKVEFSTIDFSRTWVTPGRISTITTAQRTTTLQLGARGPETLQTEL